MLQMILDQEANEKFRRGESITNEELNGLLEFYSQADMLVEQLGPEFSFASKELHNRHLRLQTYKAARLEG